jgi:DNA-binding MarR family transcriptional regulator
VETIPEQASHLRLAVTRLARRLRQEAHTELTPSLLAALATIGRHGPLTPSELAEREHVQRPNATKLIARLEDLGLLQRIEAPADRRSSLISLNDEGDQLLRELRSRKDAYLAQKLDRLPREDREALARAATLLEELL